MKRFVFPAIVVFLLLSVVSLIYLRMGVPRNDQWVRVFLAARAYQARLSTAGQVVPEAVSVQTLVDSKVLSAGDATGLERITINLFAPSKDNDPRAVLMAVNLADGSQVALLNDGSAQSRTIDLRLHSKP